MVKNVKRYNKAIVLGAGGFIGINLVNALVVQGWEVVCFDHKASPHWPKEVRTVLGEFSQMPEELLVELDNALVFHLISSGRPSSHTNYVENEINGDLIATVRYLEYCKSRSLRWLYVSSGGTVYGQNDGHAISEDAVTQPICSYGIVKLAIEKYFALYHVLHRTDFVIVRLSNPYGAWQNPKTGQGLIAALIYKALRGEQVEIWGDGENVRDYIYIDDAVEGVILAGVSGRTSEIYNIGTGIGTSINELIGILREKLNLQFTVNYLDARTVDVKRNVLDCRKIVSDTDWMPKIDLFSGIWRSSNWIKTLVE